MPDELSDLRAGQEALELRAQAATVQERLEILDRLCRDLTRIVRDAERTR